MADKEEARDWSRTRDVSDGARFPPRGAVHTNALSFLTHTFNLLWPSSPEASHSAHSAPLLWAGHGKCAPRVTSRGAKFVCSPVPTAARQARPAKFDAGEKENNKAAALVSPMPFHLTRNKTRCERVISLRIRSSTLIDRRHSMTHVCYLFSKCKETLLLLAARDITGYEQATHQTINNTGAPLASRVSQRHLLAWRAPPGEAHVRKRIDPEAANTARTRPDGAILLLVMRSFKMHADNGSIVELVTRSRAPSASQHAGRQAFRLTTRRVDID